MRIRASRYSVSNPVSGALWGPKAGAAEAPGVYEALEQLERRGQFSGAVVVRGPEGVRFARGYGLADPSTGRRFTPDTPVDGALRLNLSANVPAQELWGNGESVGRAGALGEFAR